MTLEMAFVFMIGLYIVFKTGHKVYKQIEHRRYLETHYPKYIRDRNKPFQIGQVWEEGGWKSVITAIAGNQIEHDDYVPNFYDGDTQHTYRMHSTVKEFRKLIYFHKFHLAEQEHENQLVETVKVKDLIEPPI